MYKMSKLDLSHITVKKILAVSRIDVNWKHTSSRDNRECWAIYVKIAGRTVYRSKGKEYLSDAEHVIVLPKGISYKHTFEELGGSYMIEFDAEYPEPSPDIGSYYISTNRDLVNKMIGLERKWTFKKPAYELACMSGLYGILEKLFEKEKSSYFDSAKYKLIEPALKYLEENYSDSELTADDISKVAGISSVYFRKLFSNVFGQSPMRYLQMLRMEKAKDMLSGDYVPISDVSESVGFKSIYHFSKTFKKTTGYTPTEYAKRKNR